MSAKKHDAANEAADKTQPARSSTTALTSKTRSQRWRALRELLHHRSARVGFGVIGLLTVIALLAPTISPFDPNEQNLRATLESPSSEHILGTDQFGRDILSRIIHGTQISLSVGLLVVAVSGTIGVALGVIAGFYEGWVDNLVSRLVDIALAFPGILLAIAIVAVLGPSLVNALIAISISSSPQYTRVTRGVVLSLKQNEFVQAAQVVGASNARLMFKHILPNTMAPVLVLASLGVAVAILTTSSLSFLGLGAQPPTPEWGAMLSSGRSYMRDAWWLTTFPGLAIMLTVLAINLLGDGLRDVLDPKSMPRR